MHRGHRTALAGLLLAASLAIGCGGDDENMFAPMFARLRHRVHGTVSHYDAAARTFNVTDRRGHSFAFSWNDRTMVRGTIADGATATVRYRKSASPWEATFVHVFPAAAQATAPAAPAPPAAAKPAAPAKP